jgi:hypothetical protein
MSKRCALCKCNPKKYLDFFNKEIENGYKLFDFCQHDNIILSNNYLCMRCTINSIRCSNKLKEICDKDITSMTCIKWKTGQSNDLYCWKNIVPMCDRINCNYPAIKKYITLENFINKAKKNFYFKLTVNIPIELFNIIIKYAYKIHSNKNGLCINHNNDYNISIGWVFDSIMECNKCYSEFNKNQGFMIKKIRESDNYLYGNITLHHKSSDICNPIMKIDDNNFLSGGCLELCKQLNTWCKICNKCIGHTQNINNINIHNIFKYPHCILCGIHSQHLHCNKCGLHYKYQHCDICNLHSKYQHCYICNNHDEYPHCENCWNLGYSSVHHNILTQCKKYNIFKIVQ